MRRSVVAAAVALLGAATIARAQGPIDVEEARESAWRFLTQGDDPPRPDLTRADLAQATARESDSHPRLGGTVLELRFETFTVGVSPDGTVIQYDGWDRARHAVVRSLDDEGRLRTDWERERELERRSQFGVDALRERALAVLRQRYPDFAARRFDPLPPRTDVGTLTTELRFAEVPAEGQLACYPNAVILRLHHETGEVVSYLATNVRGAVTEPPRFSREQVQALLEQRYPRGESVIELSMIIKAGRPRAVWHCGVIFADGGVLPVLLDADDGSPVERRED